MVQTNSPPHGDSPTKPSIAQTLAPYLLEKIFLFAVESDVECLDFNQQRLTPSEERRHLEELPSILSPKFTQRNVSQVCQQWRAVALDCRRLWTTIQILEPHMCTTRGMRRAFEKTKDMIERSGDLPLTMTASIGYGFTIPSGAISIISEATFQSILDTASSVRHRWEKISFTSFNEAGAPVSDSFRLDSFPLMKELILRFPIFDTMTMPYTSRMAIDLSSCSKLEVLKLDGYFRLISDGTLLEGLRHVEIMRHLSISHIHVGLCKVSMAATLVKIAPNLVTLKLDLLPGYFSDLDFGENPIKLPNLKELTLNTVDNDQEDVLEDLSYLLDLLHLPSLQALKVEAAVDLDIVALLVRSNCHLKSFTALGARYYDHARTGTLQPYDVSPHHFLPSWLSFMPELECLTLVKVDLPPAFLDQLALYDFKQDWESEDGEERDDQEHLDAPDRPSVEHSVGGQHEASSVFSDDGPNLARGDDSETASVEEGSDADSDEVNSADGEEDSDFDGQEVELCPNLKVLRLYKCSLRRSCPSVATAFVGMLTTMVMGIPGMRGKLQRLVAQSSGMEDLAENEKLQEWANRYNFQLIITA